MATRRKSLLLINGLKIVLIASDGEISGLLYIVEDPLGCMIKVKIRTGYGLIGVVHCGEDCP